jgi:MFS transporter, Spinster family, sphingosine-1-phosphate transporter
VNPDHSSPRYVLILLLVVNLLNYIDRQVLYAVFPLIKADLSLSDTALGFLGSAFMFCYMLSAPFFGWMAGRAGRPSIAAAGVAVWSLATLLSGSVAGYRSLFAARTAVGIGEASFGTVSPGLLADFFPKEGRGRIVSLFYLAIPVGSALGYLLGGVMGEKYGWHTAFLLVGAPGLLLALPVWFLREPKEKADSVVCRQTASLSEYLVLVRNRTFVITTLAMAAMTFAMGGLAQWVPSFLNRMHGLDVGKANTLFGGITVVSGVLGTLAGGFMGDRFQRKSRSGYLTVSGWGFLMGAPVLGWAIFSPTLPGCLLAIFFAETFLFFNTGPLNTVILNVTVKPLRAMAFAVNIFFIHALGDTLSPTLLGWLSDMTDLRTSLLLTPLAIIVAALFCFLGRSFIAADTDQVGE